MWYRNLKVHPDVHVQIRGEHLDRVARDASNEERKLYSPKIVRLDVGSTLCSRTRVDRRTCLRRLGDDAVQTIYDSGDRNAVVFSHGATIMFWTMMNVDNPELGLILSHPLDNTSVVVVTGNPEDGWTLENWDGVEVSADPSLPTKLFVDVRNVVTAPQTAAFRIRQAFVPKVVNGSAAVQSDEQAPSTQTALNAAIDKRSLRSVKGSADEPAAEAPKTTRLAKKTEKPNGAMNLTRVETSFTRAMPLPQAATRPGRTKPRVGRPTTTRATAPTRRPPDAAH